MKIVVTHTNVDKVFKIAQEMIDSIGESSLREVKGLQPELISSVTDAVRASIFAALKIITDGAESLTVEYNLGAGIASSFENVCKFVKKVEAGEEKLEDQDTDED